jgi:hypothetical protein
MDQAKGQKDIQYNGPNKRTKGHTIRWTKQKDKRNISNILNRKEVVKEIPPYFKNQSVPIVSYSYTNSIGRNIFNYKEALQDINIEEYLKNPLTTYNTRPSVLWRKRIYSSFVKSKIPKIFKVAYR